MFGIIFFAILLIVFSAMAENRRYRRYDRNRRYYDPYTTYPAENRSGIVSDWIRKSIRRRSAFRKAAQYLSKRRKTITLKNSNVLFLFDTKKKTFICLDVRNTKRSISVTWSDQAKSYSQSSIDNDFEKFFDTVCRSFNSSSNYPGIAEQLRQNFPVIAETTLDIAEKKLEKNNKKQKAKKAKAQKSDDEKLNINEATDEQIIALPGISVVQAKKIINRINLKGDFKSLEEFYKEMKIKPHFQEQLEDLICARESKREVKKNVNDDRIIDL